MVTHPQTRIVGIGSSAGGLEALEQFLSHTPADTGMAYIVIQHLDPTKKALLSELLQRVTTLPVAEVRQAMRIEPNCVYVIPPNTELSIVHDVLHLETPRERRGSACPSTFCSRPLRVPVAKTPLPSSFPAWARMGLWAFRPSRQLAV